MKTIVLYTVILSLPSSLTALEQTRDWQAFESFNTSVNGWLKEKDKNEAVSAEYIKFLFFKAWIMYHGPLAYDDEEAKAVKPFFVHKLKQVKKKIAFEKTDLESVFQIKDTPGSDLALSHLPTIKTLKVNHNKLTIDQFRGLINEFNTWFDGIK